MRGYRNRYRNGRLPTKGDLIEYAAAGSNDRRKPLRSTIRQRLRARSQILEQFGGKVRRGDLADPQYRGESLPI